VTYPPAPPPGYEPPPLRPPYVVQPPLRRRMHPAVLAAIVVGSVLAAAAIACGLTVTFGAKHAVDDQRQANRDVTLAHCTTTELAPGLVVGQADITAHNTGTGRATYLVEVRFESRDGGHSYGTGYASIDDLGAGQTGDDQAVGSDNIPGGLAVKCQIIDVTRI